MKKLTELAITRPLLITVIFVILILFGAISYKSLNYNLLPKFDAPIVSVITTYRGASAEEIETTVTKQIEDAVSSLEGIDKINSQSMEGASVVTIQLLNGVDVNKAQNDAQRKVDQMRSLMPAAMDDPIVNKFSSDDIPVLRMGVTADVDDKTLYDLIDQQIKPQISNIPGVGQVSLVGGNERELKVYLDRGKLQTYGLSAAQVAALVNAASLSTPAGKVVTNSSEFSIKFNAKFQGAEQLRNMPVGTTASGSQVLLKDIADVVDGQKDVTTINHINGLPSIGLQVQKQTDANAVKVSELVQERLKELKETYKSIGIKFEIASDQSTYTLQSADAVMEDLVLAIVIVSFVMLMFLHSMRSSLFVLVALPSSMIPTFIMMYLFGMSLNLMTLMALSLVVGILVDDSIVILENIMRHMEMGKNKRQATIDGRSEIGFTAMAITLVDVVVFLPMALVSGMIGNILREFALVVVFSTLMSLLVCFTLTPLLASRWGKLVHLDKNTLWGRISLWFEGMIDNLRDGYTNILQWSLRHKRWVFIGVIILFVGAITLAGAGFIGGAFISQGDQGEMVVKLELDPNASVKQTNATVQEAEHIILQEKDVINVFSNIGISNLGGLGSVSNGNYAEINVKLKDKKLRTESTDDFGLRMQKKISQIPGVKVTISPMDITGNANQAPIMVLIKGSDRAKVRIAADKIKKIVEGTAGTQYVAFSTKNPKPQIDVQLDREKMAIFGLNANDVGTAVGSAFRGNDQAKYTYNGNEYDIIVQNDDDDKRSIDDVRSLTFANAKGETFPLSQFATVKEMMGESVLERMNRLPSITVNSNVMGRSVGDVSSDITKQIDAYKKSKDWPEGVTWQFGGDVEMMQDSFASLLAALGIGILLVYLIMVALYENAVYPFVVLFALPLAIIGALLALALTMNELTIFSMIGMIMLMGLVAKNGILLVDFTNQRKAEGAGLVEALIDAGKERFRPILMTTIAMIVGMLPIALATGSGAEVKNGMAWVIIGGLTSSLVLTLVVVPCVYYVVDKLMNRVRGRRRKKMVRQVRERQIAAAH
ncbi:MAG: efflux RND transporter permease subunit [Edaphocola sp.]